MKALIVMLLCLSAFLIIGSAQVKPQADVAAHTGRYEIIINPSVRADTFLLDTQTGKTWKVTQYSDVSGAPMIWKYQEKVDNEQELRNWANQQQMVTPAAPQQ